ncbi:MAG TPA: TIGR00366 family protein [Kofleriaceae bacterium]|nr:TIGR00366 family protein [Kofleriaceae bacterium]
MIVRLGDWLSKIAARIVPDPFVIALGLTAVVGGFGAILLVGAGTSATAVPERLFRGWFAGFGDVKMLAFALQMCLVLVTGHALALAAPVQRVVRAVARLPRTAGHATLLVAIVACLAALVHWGLGAVVGALVAREVARHAADRGLRVHYPLLGAAAYTGLVVWHGGLSGSAPLKIAEADHFAAHVVGSVPVSQTLLSPLNLLIAASLVAVIPLLCWAMTPRDPEAVVPPAALPPVPPTDAVTAATWPERLGESRALGAIVGLTGLAFTLGSLVSGALAFELDAVNALMLFLGILAHGRLRRYLDAIGDGARGAASIVVQFPFYFGILGMMKASGAIAWLSTTMTDVAGPASFPLLAFLSASVVNFFIPSGGGQWAVQGEILLTAGAQLGVAPGVTVIAFAYGDAVTNMVQPFWALPLLGIMGLRARDILGYTTVVCLATYVTVSVWLVAFA